MAFYWAPVCLVFILAAGFAASQGSDPPEDQILILLDVSQSLKDSLSEVSGFIETFYSITSTEEFFQNHKRKVTVATFNEGMISGEQWVLDYSEYNTAADLQADEAAQVADIVSTINAKEANETTNIGQTLQNAMQTYSLDQNWRLILVSDFININEQPPISQELALYANAGIKIVPVIVDKRYRRKQTYNTVREAAIGEYGIDLRSGLVEADINAIYNL